MKRWSRGLIAFTAVLATIARSEGDVLQFRKTIGGGGYGAFSVSASQVAAVLRYIANQPAHHERLSFRDELVELLERTASSSTSGISWGDAAPVVPAPLGLGRLGGDPDRGLAPPATA